MPSGDKIVQIPSGERIQFPASMADADINAEITKYLGSKQTGAMQAVPGGPVFNARLVQPPTEGESTLAKISRGTALGAASGAGIPETQTPVRDLLRNIVQQGGETLRRLPGEFDQYGIAAPGAEALRFAKGIGGNLLGAGKETVSGVQARDPEQTAHGISSAVTQLLMLKGGREAAEGELGGQGLKNAAREVMGEGPSKARVLADQHAHAVATKQHLTDLAGAVHSDAQNAMSQVLAKVDEAKPGGAFNKADIQGKVKTAVGDLVQVPEKLPSSLNKILKTEEAAPPTIGGRQLNLKDPADLKAYQRMKTSGAFTPEEIKRIEGGGDTLTAEQLKQMRSDVGQELGRYGEKGVVGAALKKTYGILSSELRGAAKDVGIEKDWLEANNKYSQYSRDFTRKGPLKVALNNQTAAGIMEPLTGTARQVVMDTLQKYKDAGFNVDTDWLEGQMRHYSMGKTVTRLSQPTKMDLLMAGFSPKALAIRQLGPRIFRNPKVLSRFSGAEDVPMPTREVYPSKAAAMKAKKP